MADERLGTAGGGGVRRGPVRGMRPAGGRADLGGGAAARPPSGGDYGEIQAALDGWLGQSAQLRYPLNGELLSPF